MKKMAAFLLTMMLAGSAWGQPPQLIQKIKDKFRPAPPAQNSTQPGAVQGSTTKNSPAKPAAGQPQPSSAAASPKPSQPASSAASPKIQPASAAVDPKPATTKTAMNPQAPVKTAGTNGTKTVKPEAKPVAVKSSKPSTPPTKIAIAPIAPQPKQGAQKGGVGPFAPRPKKEVKKLQADNKPAAKPSAEPAAASAGPEKKEKKIITAEGRRDPFLSPIVNTPTGAGCSTGKRCLAIDQIIVRGVVKAETGMIAVVVNSLNKAYFLKENDPVFNGYVMKITGDSVVFKETYQDKLGKELTREVVKKITTPAV
jgi:hypothetical protein